MKAMLMYPPSIHSKNVVRDLLYGCWCKGKRIASASFPPTTLLYVATVLEQNDHEVVLLDSQAEGITLDAVKDRVAKEAPDAIIIPTSTTTYREDAQTLREIKEQFKVTTFAYGPHATFRPLDALSVEGVDYLVQREPEYIMRDVLTLTEKGQEFNHVKGLAYRHNGSPVINEPAPWIDPLDELPIPDRKWIYNYIYFNPLVKKLQWTTALTSRGCPARCNFCTSPFFYGNTLRYRSAENIVTEMEYLQGLGYKEIFYRDETFTANRRRVEEMCRLIKERGVKMSWICNARVGTVTKELMKTMVDSGCHMLKIGVESGVQEILNNIQKGTTVEWTRKTFQWAHEVGMEIHAHTMLGSIGETRETVETSIRFLKEIEPTTVTCGVFTAYPGTPVFKILEDKNLKDVGDGTQRNVKDIHTKGLHNEQWSELSDQEAGLAVKRLYRKFYMRPSYIARRLATVRSLEDAKRLAIAGMNVLSFSMREDE